MFFFPSSFLLSYYVKTPGIRKPLIYHLPMSEKIIILSTTLWKRDTWCKKKLFEFTRVYDYKKDVLLLIIFNFSLLVSAKMWFLRHYSLLCRRFSVWYTVYPTIIIAVIPNKTLKYIQPQLSFPASNAFISKQLHCSHNILISLISPTWGVGLPYTKLTAKQNWYQGLSISCIVILIKTINDIVQGNLNHENCPICS